MSKVQLLRLTHSEELGSGGAQRQNTPSVVSWLSTTKPEPLREYSCEIKFDLCILCQGEQCSKCQMMKDISLKNWRFLSTWSCITLDTMGKIQIVHIQSWNLNQSFGNTSNNLGETFHGSNLKRKGVCTEMFMVIPAKSYNSHSLCKPSSLRKRE